MKKIETIWHDILYESLEKRHFKRTQQEIARKLGYSLSTVNHSLKVPLQIGAIRKSSKFFVLQDFKKLLYYWASVRNLSRDIIYQTFLPAPVQAIEGMAPSESVYACYAAARHRLGEPPADYAKVYFYIPPDSLTQFQERFPPDTTNAPNVFALRLPPNMPHTKEGTTLAHTFVDIWNLSDWYAKDFTSALERKIDELLS